MSFFDYFLIIFVVAGLWFITNQHIELTETRVITAIQDNGCSSHQELKPTKTNADVYNCDALSTSY